jgi:hypothetical protein
MKDITNYQEALYYLCKPFPEDSINFRVERSFTNKDGKRIFKVVPYLDTRAIIYRMNALIPGKWSLETDIQQIKDFDFEQGKSVILGFYAKSTLQIFDVRHSDVGSTTLPYDSIDNVKKQLIKLDPKTAVTDSIRRVAALHGIGLYFWFLKKPLFIDNEEETKNLSASKKVKEYVTYINEVASNMYTMQFSSFNKRGINVQ